MISDQEVEHFDTFGFLVRRGCYPPGEMETISRCFDELLSEDRDGQPFDAARGRQSVFAFVERRPQLRAIAEDDRIYRPIEQILGSDFVWIGSAANAYVGDTYWHPDNNDPEYRRIKVVFYLDPVRADTGCLRVIPGSHRPPLYDELRPHKNKGKDAAEHRAFGVLPHEIPFFPLESDPGDVVFFDQCTWHAAFGGSEGRRMFTLNFGQQATSPRHMEVLRKLYEGNRNNIAKLQRTPSARAHDQEFLHSGSPRVQRMVRTLVEQWFE